jgi:hypothetical protein
MRTFNFPIGIDDNGEIVVINGLDALRQKIQQRLQFFKGSWILDTNRGVPWLQDILKIPIDDGLAASIINSEILKEPDVVSINEVVTDIDINRKLSYSAKISTVYGETEVTL